MIYAWAVLVVLVVLGVLLFLPRIKSICGCLAGYSLWIYYLSVVVILEVKLTV